MDAKLARMSGMLVMAGLMWGCQSRGIGAGESERDQVLREYAKANGAAVPAGPVDVEKLAKAMVAKGDKEAEETISQLRKQSEETSGDKAALKKALTKRLETVRAAYEVAAVNIANDHSMGYRRAMVDQIGRDMKAGAVVRTGRQLDVSIAGEGFLVLQNLETKERVYTRAGMMLANDNGYLTITMPEKGEWRLEPPIQLPKSAKVLEITREGRVMAKSAGEDVPNEVGQVNFAIFRDAGKLATSNGSYFAATEESGKAVMGNPGEGGRGVLNEGYLELSNVNVEVEMLTLNRLGPWFAKLTQALSMER